MFILSIGLEVYYWLGSLLWALDKIAYWDWNMWWREAPYSCQVGKRKTRGLAYNLAHSLATIKIPQSSSKSTFGTKPLIGGHLRELKINRRPWVTAFRQGQLSMWLNTKFYTYLKRYEICYCGGGGLNVVIIQLCDSWVQILWMITPHYISKDWTL